MVSAFSLWVPGAQRVRRAGLRRADRRGLRVALAMTKLKGQTCEACRRGAPPATIRNLHVNDFVMAAKTDEVFGR